MVVDEARAPEQADRLADAHERLTTLRGDAAGYLADPAFAAQGDEASAVLARLDEAALAVDLATARALIARALQGLGALRDDAERLAQRANRD